MDKSHAIKALRAAGQSERRIAKSLGISRMAVRRHLGLESSNETKAPTGKAPIGSDGPNETKAPTGSDDAGTPSNSAPITPSRSRCEAFRDTILVKLDQGLTAQRIHQDLRAEHGFEGGYPSVRRYVRRLSAGRELPFRRIEVEPGAEMQVDYGTGAPCLDAEGRRHRTHVFRLVLGHSRKGYSEAVRRLTTESFIRSLENAFWALGGVPRTVVFDNARAVVSEADWHDPERIRTGNGS